MNISGRTFWIVAALLLAVLGAAQVSSVVQETQTWDEAGHLTAGYIYLKTGSLAFYTDHPPLRAVFALPLLFFKGLRLNQSHETWRQQNKTDFATVFLYTNPYHPDRLLLAGRLVAIALTLLFGLVLAIWSRRHFGDAAALFALLLFAFDPNLIAHGRYIATDMLSAFTFFLTVIAWGAFLERPGALRLAGAGAALGLALAAKFSAVLLGPVLVLLFLIRWWQGKIPLRRLVPSLAGAGAVALAVLVICYWPETRDWQGQKPLAEVVDTTTPAGRTLAAVAGTLHIPAHPYLVGLYEVARHNSEGHEAYLLGQTSHSGWWYYFPVVFAVKTPLAVLLLLAGVAVSLAILRPNLRAARFEWYLLAVPALFYFAISMTSAINIGVRHLLSVYPLLYALLAAAVVQSRRGPWIAAALALLLAIESAAIYPHYLAFFNAASGGPSNGPKYLVDSNIDWGQDVKKLRSWLAGRGAKEACMSYFGNTGVEFYGIHMLYLPAAWETDARRDLDCWAAISVTTLMDVYMQPGRSAWLRKLEPAAKVGYSIYVYDLRRGQ